MTDPTGLHTDLADAVNLCLFATPSSIAEMEQLMKLVDHDLRTTNFAAHQREPAALWHIFHRDVYEDVKRYGI